MVSLGSRGDARPRTFAGDRVRAGGQASRGRVARDRRYESENELLDTDPEVDGMKTGMTDEAGSPWWPTRAVPRLGVQLYAAVIGAPSAARARPRWPSGCSTGASRSARRADVPAGGHRAGRRAGRGAPRRRGALPRRRGPPARRCCSGRPISQTRGRAGRGDGPVAGGRDSARSRVPGRRTCSGEPGWWPSGGDGGPGIWDHLGSGLVEPHTMIVTVTLNAALDRTVRVPEPPARRAPPRRRLVRLPAARASTSRAP